MRAHRRPPGSSMHFGYQERGSKLLLTQRGQPAGGSRSCNRRYGRRVEDDGMAHAERRHGRSGRVNRRWPMSAHAELSVLPIVTVCLFGYKHAQ
jgi:hypothetical protein